MELESVSAEQDVIAEASIKFEDEYPGGDDDNRTSAGPGGAAVEEEESRSPSDEDSTSVGEDSFLSTPTQAEKTSRRPAVLRLFSFATCFDWLLMSIGTIAAVLHGFVLPGSMLVLGELINVFAYRNITGDIATVIYNTTVGNVVSDSQLNCSLIEAQIAAASGTASTILSFQCLNNADFTNMVDILVLGFVGLGVGGFVLGFIQVSTFSLAATRQTHCIRKRFYRSILRQNVAWFDENKAGELNSRLVDDLIKVQDGIGDKLGISIQLVCNFLFAYVVGFVLEWRLTLFMVGCAPFLVGASLIFTKLLSVFFNREQVQYAKAGAVAEEVLGSIRTVVAFGGEQKEYNRYKGKLADAKILGVTKGAITGVMNGLIYVIIFTVYAAALTFGAYLIDRDFTAPGQVLTVFFAVMIGAFSLGQAGPSLEELGVAAGAMEFIYETIHRVPPIDISSDEGVIPNHIEGKVEFKNVTFTYPTRPDTVVMDNFSVEANVGKTLALVGPSGSGKSTTVQLIQRFYDVDEGSVLLDGKDLRELNLKWLRKNIGIVSQEPVLFATTIAENIRYGREGVTREEIEAAAKAANAHNFIMSLPDNYETLAGGSGAQMSGGQKQRIAIARALVRDPKILLLDEATSALDAESEGIVQDALDKARQGRTTIVIAHRLSTIRNADTIAVLSGGHVAESGTHDTLMARKGLYCDLVTSQTDGQREIFDEKTMVEYRLSRLESKTVVRRTSSARTKPSLVRQLTRLGSMGVPQTIEEPDEEDTPHAGEMKEYDATIPKVSLWRVMRLNAKEWWLLLLGALGSLLEGATFPVFAIIIGEILRALLQANPLEEIWQWSVILCGVGISVGFGVLCKTFCFTTSGTILTGRLRKRAFKAMLRQEMGWFDDKFNSTGALTTRLAGDAAQVQGATGSRLGTLCQVTVTLLLSLLVAFIYSWSLALILLGYAPILFVAAAIQLTLIAAFNKRNKKDAEEAGKVSVESIDNIRTVAGLTIEHTFYTLYCERINAIRRRSRFLPFLVGLLYGFSQGILIMGYAIIFRYGAFQVIQRTDSNLFTISFDLLRVFTVLLFGAVSIGQLFAVAPGYTKARIAANRIFAILNRIPAIDSYSKEGERPDKAQGDIELSDVHFSYPARPEVEVLKGLSVSVQQGKTLALVGPSGCGKSTVVSLIERFYEPSLEQGGSVEVDGKELRELNIQWLRSKIGLVSQEPVLFDGSIADNIRYGDLSREISDEEMEAAATAANIHDFIMSQPKGYDTNVGGHGVNMSGGQKQRIAIARALVRDPKILLLDEATSALDARAERTVQTALDVAQEGRTSIVIAHRLSTIRNADQIAVIKCGRVEEIGTHNELLERGGLYYRLNRAQLVAAREHKKTMMRRASTARTRRTRKGQ